MGFASQGEGPDGISQCRVHPLDQGAILTFKTDKEGGIREIISCRYRRFVHFRAVRGNDVLGCLIIPLGHSWPVMANPHGETRKRLEIGPVFTVDSQSSRQEPD